MSSMACFMKPLRNHTQHETFYQREKKTNITLQIVEKFNVTGMLPK